MSILAGVDYSYTSPAICIYDTTKELSFQNLMFYNFTSVKKLAGRYGENILVNLMPAYETQEQRFRNITDWASKILTSWKVDEVVLEGYAMGASSGLVFQIAENTSLLKQFMDLNGIKFTTPAPSAVKKNFTGKGNAKKDLMVKTFEDTFQLKLFEILGVKDKPQEPVKPIDDLVDAYANMKMHDHFKGS